MERKTYKLHDIVMMKKPHPCGVNEMEIIRMGMDIRIKCTGCKHSILMPRSEFGEKDEEGPAFGRSSRITPYSYYIRINVKEVGQRCIPLFILDLI